MISTNVIYFLPHHGVYSWFFGGGLGFFWLHHVACGILVQQPGIEPGPLAVRALSPDHWTAREFPGVYYFDFHLTCQETVAMELVNSSACI